ncbi:hypothetical protein, partial [Treponema sp. Marseille-Q4130]|uniref:hypothetical protein n=1 Tax=Treponema sp. Marseille-Q4130 TaxID=2766702 RepID=UPI0019BA7F4A
MAIINDKALIEEISGTDIQKLIGEKLKEQELSEFKYFPLCDDIIKQLKSLIVKTESIEYFQLNEVEALWLNLIDKSIQCLRFFDEREPFQKNNDSDLKKPITYGLDRIKKYLEKYSDFESLLYGSSSYYRDHIFHSLRTWLLGIFCLLRKTDDKKAYFIDCIGLDGLGKNDFSDKINFFEKLSIWTIAALCHDLGYPLEKSRKILDKTKNMMGEFVPNPSILDNFNFGGIQDNINDFIIRFLSTKMVPKKIEDSTGNGITYFGRIQPKYYLKYSKSLENFDHGIISAVIIYKMLLYFLESDFNMNDDYEYKSEDARQFYIRREILRPMASHTCSDIYNIHLNTFSSLLFVCDELQEWGRKSWNELYTGLQPSSINLKIENFSKKKISVTEEVRIPDVNDKNIVFE